MASGPLVQIGERSGSVVILGRKGTTNAGAPLWLGRCDCGVEFGITTSNLRHGGGRCFRCARASAAAKRVVHGDARKTRLYRIWTSMRARCNTPSATNYRWYGGRGISICENWNDFAAFRTWAHDAGYADHLTIDRIDGDGHYTPENCRWVTIQDNVAARDAARHARGLDAAA